MLEDKPRVRMPLPSALPTQNEIGSVPSTSGVPNWTPSPDQLPLAYDAAVGILYFYSGESWKAFGLSALKELNFDNMINLDNVLRIPVTYVSGGSQVEGYVTLKDFKRL